MIQLPWLDPTDSIHFPNTSEALDFPNGLLAIGGKLSPEWLLKAYALGVFPWFNEDEPILWWSPSPRSIIYIDQLHISRRLQKTLRKKIYQITFDTEFAQVINACSKPRLQQEEAETWISRDIIDVYTQLHQQSYAHSVEVWENETLVGGVYGIALGKMFFGESMFSFRPNTSKIALFYLVEQLKKWHYVAIDCQVHSNHLETLGATRIQRAQFEYLIKQHVTGVRDHWNTDLTL